MHYLRFYIRLPVNELISFTPSMSQFCFWADMNYPPYR
jgi:hypothetical protein